jgi:hypothetical protein
MKAKLYFVGLKQLYSVYLYGPGLRIRIRDEQPLSYFREIKKQFELKHLNSLMWIREGQNLDPG